MALGGGGASDEADEGGLGGGGATGCFICRGFLSLFTASFAPAGRPRRLGRVCSAVVSAA